MGIALGFLCLASICVLLLKAVTHRCKLEQADRLLMNLHKPAYLLALALCPLHILFVLPVLRTRSPLVYGAGILAAVICALLAVCFHGMRQNKTAQLRWHQILSGLLLVCAALHVTAAVADFLAYQANIRHVTPQEIDLSQVTAGTYIGTYDAGYIYAKVQVTALDGTLQRIDILEHWNERGQSAERVLQDIVRTQQYPVDAIGGATNSSKVLQQAVANALADAATP